MNLSLTEEQNLIKSSAEKYFSEKFSFEKRQKYLQHKNNKNELLKNSKEFGWLALPFQSKYGGLDGDITDVMTLIEVFGGALSLDPYIFTLLLPGLVIEEFCSEEKKQLYLNKILEGSESFSFCFAEPHQRFNFLNIKSDIIKKNQCYLVEGYTDLISLHQKGIQNVVASSGTAITVDQVRLIKRFTDNVSFIFDSDEAGQKATYRGVDLFLSEGMFANIILLPEGFDPDSFAKRHTYEELSHFFNSNQKDFISFKCEMDLKDNNPQNKIKLIDSILNSISLAPTITMQTVYIQLAAEKLNIDENILLHELELKRDKVNKKIYYSGTYQVIVASAFEHH